MTSGQKQMNNWHPSLPPTSHPFLDCLITQLHVSYFGDLAFVPVPLKYLIEKKTAGKSVMFPQKWDKWKHSRKNHPFPKGKIWKDTKGISTVSLPKQTGVLPGTQCSGASQFQKLGHLQRKEFEKMLRGFYIFYCDLTILHDRNIGVGQLANSQTHANIRVYWI